MTENSYDFSGWATKSGIKCTDGRTITDQAFIADNGKKVPLVWGHKHDDPFAVLGHAILEHRPGGMYAYCKFNDSESGKQAKTLVTNDDVCALSIWANQLKHDQNRNVLHGEIKEVSLVLAGANRGALIDNVIVHGDLTDDDIYVFGYDGEIELFHEGIDISEKIEHSDKQEEKQKEDEPVPTDEKQKETSTGELTPDKIKEILNGMTEEQKNVMYGFIGMALNTKDEGDDENMSKVAHNLFEGEVDSTTVLSHDDFNEIIADAKRIGSLRESFMAHAEDYGIENIEMLFPEYQSVNGAEPAFIKRTPDGWVDKVLNGVHHSPFARIKMAFADITGDEARAKGYMKGNLKKEEVFGLLKRVIGPTTIYKKQKLDRDDTVDITDFNVIAWLKAEMRIMLNEEIARAVVFGDGRSNSSEDKIKENCIIPIIKDTENNFFAMEKTVTPEENEAISHAIINACVKSQDDYEGSGNTILFTAASTVTDMLLMEDGFNRRLYKDMSEIALACGVNEIVKVPASIIPDGIYGVIVDLKDYTIGADKGGAVNMFDDFDIDYNQMKYLMETRCSGGLTKYHSAVVLKSAS